MQPLAVKKQSFMHFEEEHCFVLQLWGAFPESMVFQLWLQVT